MLKALLPAIALAVSWLAADAGGPSRTLGHIDASRKGSSSPAMEGGLSSSACLACHRMDPLFSHPVDVTPSMHVPAGLPLQAGRVTCVTCHESSRLTTHAENPPRHDPVLRNGAAGEDLCVVCHRDQAQSVGAMHPLGIGRAHLTNGSRTGTSGSRSLAFDEESRTCLSCHDGSVATDATDGMQQGSPGDHTRSHPVGIRYARSPGGIDPLLTAPGTLDARIRLFDGNVGCGSCHSPYSKEQRLLVLSNHRSRLCLSCHRYQ